VVVVYKTRASLVCHSGTFDHRNLSPQSHSLEGLKESLFETGYTSAAPETQR